MVGVVEWTFIIYMINKGTGQQRKNGKLSKEKFNLLIKTAEEQSENKNLKKIKIFDIINKLKKWALCKNTVPFFI